MHLRSSRLPSAHPQAVANYFAAQTTTCETQFLPLWPLVLVVFSVATPTTATTFAQSAAQNIARPPPGSSPYGATGHHNPRPGDGTSAPTLPCCRKSSEIAPLALCRFTGCRNA